MTLKIFGAAVFFITASHWLIDVTGFNDPPPVQFNMGPK
jgi:hypothetical protein